MAVKFNDEEQRVLSGHGHSSISLQAKWTYSFGIRPFMDYKTGLVGFKRVVSYQSLIELLEYAPPAGSKRKSIKPEMEAIRAVLAELERAGLVKWIRSKARGLFFECLLADTDFSAQKQEQHVNNIKEQHLNNRTKSRAVTEFDDIKNSHEQHHDLPRNNTPPNTVNSVLFCSGASEIENDDDAEIAPLKFEPKSEQANAAQKWIEYFVKNHGFRFHEAQTPATIAMYIDWEQRNVPLDVVERSILAANAWLAGKGSSRANNPCVYRKFVNETLVRDKQNLQAQKSRDTLASNHGLIINQNPTGINYANNNTTNGQSGRKLSVAEQQAATRRWLDQQQQELDRELAIEREQQARVIN